MKLLPLLIWYPSGASEVPEATGPQAESRVTQALDGALFYLEQP